MFNLYFKLSSNFFILKPWVLFNKRFAKTFLVKFQYKFNKVKFIGKKWGLEKKYFLNWFTYEKLVNLITYTRSFFPRAKLLLLLSFLNLSHFFFFNFFRLQSSLNFLLIYNNKKFLSFYYFFKFFSFFFFYSTRLKQIYVDKSIKKRIKFSVTINKLAGSLKRIKNKVLKRIVKRPFFASAMESLYGFHKNFSNFFFNSILNLHNNQFFHLKNYKNSLYTLYIYLMIFFFFENLFFEQFENIAKFFVIFICI